MEDDKDLLYEQALQAILRIHSDTSVPVNVTRKNLAGLRDEIDLLIDTLRGAGPEQTFECSACKSRAAAKLAGYPDVWVWPIEDLANPEAPPDQWICISCDMEAKYPSNADALGGEVADDKACG